jgi:hypothetical protein
MKMYIDFCYTVRAAPPFAFAAACYRRHVSRSPAIVLQARFTRLATERKASVVWSG